MKDNILVYVVTRAGRRTEDRNYTNASDASLRAEHLRQVLREWDPSQVNQVEVVKTNKPHQIR